MRVRVGRWAIQSMLALAAASASGQPRPRRAGACRGNCAGRGRRAGGAAGAGLALGAQGLRAGALAAGADPHRAQGPGQPDLGRLGLPRHQGRPDHHQLPRRQRGGAEARAPRAGLRHRRRPRGAAARSCSSTCCTTWPCSRPATPPARPSTPCPFAPRASRCPRASASTRSAIRSTSASRSCRAPTTAWSSAASIRRSSSAARSRAG